MQVMSVNSSPCLLNQVRKFKPLWDSEIHTRLYRIVFEDGDEEEMEEAKLRVTVDVCI